MNGYMRFMQPISRTRGPTSKVRKCNQFSKLTEIFINHLSNLTKIYQTFITSEEQEQQA